MTMLLVDRSTPLLVAALVEGGRITLSHEWQGEPSRAPGWLPELVGLVQDVGVELSEISGYVCGMGPGSFSGIRGALAGLSGLALPLERPVYGVASSAIMAAAVLGGSGAPEVVSVVGDARRERLWSVSYRVDEGGRVLLDSGGRPTHRGGDFKLVPRSELRGNLPDESLIISPDWGRLDEWLQDNFEAERLRCGEVYPTARAFAELVTMDLEALVCEPVPVYLHPAVAAKGG